MVGRDVRRGVQGIMLWKLDKEAAMLTNTFMVMYLATCCGALFMLGVCCDTGCMMLWLYVQATVKLFLVNLQCSGSRTMVSNVDIQCTSNSWSVLTLLALSKSSTVYWTAGTAAVHCPELPIQKAELLLWGVLTLMDIFSNYWISLHSLFWQKKSKTACKTVLWWDKGAKQRLLAKFWFPWSVSLSALETECSC